MNDKSIEQIAHDLEERVPSGKSAFLVIVDKETSEASISVKDMNDAHMLATLIHIYKTISPFGRDLAKIAIKKIDCETASQESGSLKINLN